MLPEADGSLVLAGTTNTGAAEVVRLLPDGSLDPSFGHGGIVTPAVGMTPEVVLAGPNGDLLVLGSATDTDAHQPNCLFPSWRILRLLPDGSPDATFGKDGLVVVSGVQADGGDALLQPDGRILLATTVGAVCAISPTVPAPDRAAVARVLPDGQLDQTFGKSGKTVLPIGQAAAHMALLGDGSVLVTTSIALMKLDPMGQLDASFGHGTWVTLPWIPVSLLPEPDGGALVSTVGSDLPPPNGGKPKGAASAFIASPGGHLMRVTSDGSPDAGWGTGGTFTLPASIWPSTLLPLAGGQTLMVGPAISQWWPGLVVPRPQPPMSSTRIVRFTAAGKIDATLGGPNGLVVPIPFGGTDFGVGGVAGLPSNTFSTLIARVAQGPNGSVIIGGGVEIGAYFGEGEATWLQQYAVARLTSSYQLDPSFGSRQPLGLTTGLPARTRVRGGLLVRVSSSQAAVTVVSVSTAGQVVAQGTVPWWSAGQRTIPIALTRAGRRLIRGPHRLTVRFHGEDLAGNVGTVTTSREVTW